LVVRLHNFGRQLTKAYMQSYRERLGETDLWPKDEKQRRKLLDLFLLEKAFYEIEYELTNRPDWADIPLEATLRILRQQGVIAS
jgi:maltose alpha-D-glucosyltransferase/alpha-amylase